MSNDTRQQIRELAEFQRSNRLPVELSEIQRTAHRSILAMRRRSLRGPAFAATAMAAVVILIGGLALLFSETEAPSADTVPADTLPTATMPPTTRASDRSDLGFSGLAWERIDPDSVPAHLGLHPLSSSVIDGGDRFVVFGGGDDLTEVSFSFDGLSWATHRLESTLSTGVRAVAWQDTVLVSGGGGGWSREETGPILPVPSVLSVVRGDGAVDRRIFDGDVLSMAVGPAGIVVVISPNASYGSAINEVLGSDFLEVPYQVELRDGVLFVETFDGRTGEVVLADHGLDEELSAPGWYSDDGFDWEPIPDLPLAMAVTGIADGFVGISGTTAWHSEDGLQWDLLGDLPSTADPWRIGESPMRWREGVVVTDGRHYAYLSAKGIEMIPDPPRVLSTVTTAPFPLYLAGDLGIVVVNPVEGELLVTADGENWHVGELPGDMIDTFGWHGSTGAVTSQAVLLLLWEETAPDGSQQAAIWLGTRAESSP